MTSPCSAMRVSFTATYSAHPGSACPLTLEPLSDAGATLSGCVTPVADESHYSAGSVRSGDTPDAFGEGGSSFPASSPFWGPRVPKQA